MFVVLAASPGVEDVGLLWEWGVQTHHEQA